MDVQKMVATFLGLESYIDYTLLGGKICKNIDYSEFNIYICNYNYNCNCTICNEGYFEIFISYNEISIVIRDIDIENYSDFSIGILNDEWEIDSPLQPQIESFINKNKGGYNSNDFISLVSKIFGKLYELYDELKG